MKWLTEKCRESESFANILTGIGIITILLIAFRRICQGQQVYKSLGGLSAAYMGR
ncbi:MAG: hypothetical protein ACM3TR_09715 [Caulobacteraceae bacterium]